MNGIAARCSASSRAGGAARGPAFRVPDADGAGDGRRRDRAGGGHRSRDREVAPPLRVRQAARQPRHMSDERELEGEEQSLRAAYGKLPRLEPGPALDRAVLARARAALGERPANRARPRWLLPVGLAATAVLAVGIASRIGHEPEQRWPARPVPPAAEQQAPA